MMPRLCRAAGEGVADAGGGGNGVPERVADAHESWGGGSGSLIVVNMPGPDSRFIFTPSPDVRRLTHAPGFRGEGAGGAYLPPLACWTPSLPLPTPRSHPTPHVAVGCLGGSGQGALGAGCRGAGSGVWAFGPARCCSWLDTGARARTTGAADGQGPSPNSWDNQSDRGSL